MEQRGTCMIFAVCIFRYTHTPNVCVCVLWKRLFLFVSLKRRSNHSYSKHTSHGPRPQRIVLLVSFQKDTLRRARRPWAKGQQKEGNFAFRLERKNNPHFFSSQSITIQENDIFSLKK